METTYDKELQLQAKGLQITGLLKLGRQTFLPLIVFIHGGGTNAAYFDNKGHSYVLPVH